jgi:hypothetical protein
MRKMSVAEQRYKAILAVIADGQHFDEIAFHGRKSNAVACVAAWSSDDVIRGALREADGRGAWISYDMAGTESGHIT